MAKPRLRKTDLPDDRRYSRERIWVLPVQGEPARLRLGAALPAVSDEKQTAYFVEVRRSGTITHGRPFGFIDVETGRFDLVAPLTGRILAWNRAIEDDPGLVSSNPWGRGWLCEVERLGDGLFERLFDRDGFYAYLEFELEARRLGLQPTLDAAYRLETGAPWPDDIRVLLGGKQILRARHVRLGRNETFTPQWAPGDSWTVRVEMLQPSIEMVPAEFARPKRVERKWRFEVLDDMGEVDGEPCYVVKAIEIEGAPPLTFHRLSIAKSDFSLRLIEEESVYDPARRSRAKNYWGAEGYLELREPRELIVDLPLFPAENRYEKRLVNVEGEPSFIQETRFPDERTMTIVCETRAPGADEAAPPLRSEQTWERGLPWWKKAQRTVGADVLIRGELVS